MANVTSTTGISSTLGSYSGITSQDIDKLIEAESLPILKLNNQKSKITEQQNAWKDVKLRLNTFLTKLDNLQKNEAFNTKKISNSDDKKVSFKASDKASNENYAITVDQLATASRLVSNDIVALKDKTVFEELSIAGNLEFTGEKGKKITVDINNEDSLKEITNKINEVTKETGVKAAIVDNHLVLANVETGKKSFDLSGSLMSDLGLDVTNLKLGKQAEFTIDGMKVVRDSNTVTDVVEEVTIQLKATSKEPIQIEVTQDIDETIKSVKGLVEQYNSTMDFINEKLSVGDPSKKGNKTGALSGDSSLIRLQSSLRTMMTSPIEGADKSEISRPSDLGITSKDRTSTIVFDEEKFRKALEKDPAAVQKFFFNEVKTSETIVDDAGKKTVNRGKEVSGYTKGIKELLNGFIIDDKDKKSVYTTKSNTFEQTIKDLDKRIEKFTDQVDKKRDYYVRTFTRLDQVMMQAEEQMAYLQSQLTALTGGQ